MRNALQKGAWWVADYAFVAYWQCRAIFGRARVNDYRSGQKRPVLVIPGVWERWSFMLPLVRAAHSAGHPVFVVTALGGNRAPVDESAQTVAAFIQANDLEDVLIVAHSKGGLIGKYVMAYRDERCRITGMVAVSTPFNGSNYARFLMLPSLRAFSPDDPTVRRLAASREVNPRIVSVYAQFDPHIPGGSGLLGAQNIELPTGGHFRILAKPQTFEIVRERASAPPSADWAARRVE
ncbi:triacylglycerol lipase [Homoserinimonas sp. OAct 916]|uniref:esterase/lipase family protein n=1 Tax=Homoserinimonas sp. OAct 916 TaxID=2211450 RepID=UPI000DBE306B|nr:alpha/beta hydrolase [Homoserinimonas sp. OAct 916]